MASFAGFVRAHILQGGEKLGVRNLRGHSRYVAEFTFGTWKRKIERFILLECHDNEKGESAPAGYKVVSAAGGRA